MQAENNLNSIAHGISRRGLMLVLSSPSGAGKSSISRRLLESEDNLHLSVSATSRKRRPGEVEGVDYQFVNNEDFRLMINNDEFLEYAKVFDHYYGTPRAQVDPGVREREEEHPEVDRRLERVLEGVQRRQPVRVGLRGRGQVEC